MMTPPTPWKRSAPIGATVSPDRSVGAAGLSLSLASGTPAATGGPVADNADAEHRVCHEITLGEEEISGQPGDVLCLRQACCRR